MPKIDLEGADYRVGRYPALLHAYTGGITDDYRSIALGDLAGLTQFGVNKAILPPQTGTAMRHWHETQDEFVIILSGTATLIDKDGAVELGAGECAGFKAGDDNGHAIVNRSDADVVLLEIGTRTAREVVHYSDHDLINISEMDGAIRTYAYTTKDGTIVPTS